VALSSITKWLKSPSIRLPLAIVLFAAATVCMLWIGIFRWANEEEKEALFQMHRDTENLVIAFREGALGIVTAIDHVMVVVKADYERDPDHLRLPDWIDKLPALLGTTIQVSIIGADGRARLSSADNSVDFSDRADFRYHLSPTALQPYFSAPVRDHVSGKLSIQITRRLEPVVSSFAGVVVVSLDPSYLFRFFDRVQLGGDGVVLLLGRDGIVRAGRTHAPGAEHDDLSDTRLFTEISLAEQGTFRARSPVDGIDRVVSFAAVPGYPLAVIVGLGVDEALSQVREELWGNILLGALVSLIVAGLAALLLRQVALREEAEARMLEAQKMESIGRLTGGVAHDFGNMLTVIGGNLERVLRGEREPEKVKLLKNIERTVSHGARLVHHLLAFARRQRLHPEPLDINRLVESFVGLLETTCGSTILISLELGRNVWLAMADANQLETAVLNVTLNARDAMPEGGRIAIETANVGSGDPRPRALPPGDFVAITIRDTGTGMTSEVLAKAFEPFFTTKEFGRGTGLGLSQTAWPSNPAARWNSTALRVEALRCASTCREHRCSSSINPEFPWPAMPSRKAAPPSSSSTTTPWSASS